MPFDFSRQLRDVGRHRLRLPPALSCARKRQPIANRSDANRAQRDHPSGPGEGPQFPRQHDENISQKEHSRDQGAMPARTAAPPPRESGKENSCSDRNRTDQHRKSDQETRHQSKAVSLAGTAGRPEREHPPAKSARKGTSLFGCLVSHKRSGYVTRRPAATSARGHGQTVAASANTQSAAAPTATAETPPIACDSEIPENPTERERPRNDQRVIPADSAARCSRRPARGHAPP